MTEASNQYAKLLLELEISEQEIAETEQIFDISPMLKESFKSPLVSQNEKERVIDRIFPAQVRTFLKVVCRHGRMEQIDEIFAAYKELILQRDRVMEATLTYVTPPDSAATEKMKAFLQQKYHKEEIKLSLVHDDSLLGGFLLQAEGCEYDYSLRGRYKRLSQALIRR